MRSIAPYTIEEAYEVSDAIDQGNWQELEGELGDLLLQVIYFTQIGSEDGHFSFESVVKNVSDKMVRRHPHVFGEKKAVQVNRPTNYRLGRNKGARAVKKTRHQKH